MAQLVNNTIAGIPENESIGRNLDQHACGYRREGNSTVRFLKVPYRGHQDLVKQILGYTTYAPGDRAMKRYLPWRDFDNKGGLDDGFSSFKAGQYASRVEVHPSGPAGQNPEELSGADPNGWPMRMANDYQWAGLVIHFETPPYPVGTLDAAAIPSAGVLLGAQPPNETERYCAKQVHPGREFVSFKTGSFVYANSADSRTPVHFPIPQILTFQSIVVTWFDIPRNAYPYTAIANCQNKVNDTILQLPGFPPPLNYDAGTILLETHDIIEGFFPDGERCCHIRYHFRYRFNDSGTDPQTGEPVAFGWNYVASQRGTFELVLRSSTGKPIYDSADFSELFKPQPGSSFHTP